MCDTPMAAVTAHMAAINGKDRAQLAATIAFPFLHTNPDGRKFWAATEADLPDPARAKFSRSAIQAVDVLASSGDLNVYRLTFQRYDADDRPSLRVQGLWAVHRMEDGGWKVGWRQYLGEV